MFCIRLQYFIKVRIVIVVVKSVFFEMKGADITMRTYQLKIVLENAAPPVWRRCVVPEMIDLFQLSQVIQILFGWSGEHLADFSNKNGVRIAVDHPGMEDGWSQWGTLDRASDVFLNEFLLLKKNAWIRYTYDFGDEWQHKVIFERTIEDDEAPCPRVVKAQGDNPVEDCGGIWNLDSGETHGMEREPFDKEGVNEALQHVRIPDWDEDDDEVLSDEEWLDDDELDMDDGRLVDNEGNDYVLLPVTMKDTMTGLRKEDILSFAEGKGFSIRKSWPQAKCLQMLCRQMLQPETVRRYLLWMPAKEMLTLLPLLGRIDVPEPLVDLLPDYDYSNEGFPPLHYLMTAGYTASYDKIHQGIALDAAQVLSQTLLDDDFWQDYAQVGWLENCLSMAIVIYHDFPFDVFLQLVRRRPDIAWTDEEILEKLQTWPQDMQNIAYVDGWFGKKDEKERAFYIPTKREIRNHSCLDMPNEKLLAAFTKEFEELGAKWTAPQNIDFLYVLIEKVIQGLPMKTIKGFFMEESPHAVGMIKKKRQKEWYKLEAFLKRIQQHVRQPAYGGFSAYELEQKKEGTL